MTELETKLAEALRHIEGAATDQRVQRYEIRAAATEALRLFDEAKAATPAPAEQVALRDFAERVGIRMDCWDMGAASMAYSDGCHGVTRVHLERLAQMVGVSFWNAARKLEREALAATPAPAPLTDEQIDGLDLAGRGVMSVRDMVRIVERAHGIGASEGAKE